MLRVAHASRFACFSSIYVSPKLTTIQQRGVKKWFGDEVQLFVNEFQHEAPVDHLAYQIRRKRYALKGKSPPKANDYDSDGDDISDLISNHLPGFADPKKFQAKIKEKMTEAYKDYRRETKIAKDDPRSPYYFETEEEAKKAALEHATFTALGQYEKRLEEGYLNNLPQFSTKHKLVTDVRPIDTLDSSKNLPTYLPEPDPGTYTNWEAYPVEFPLHVKSNDANVGYIKPVTYPQPRKVKQQEDGSAVARGTRKSAIAYATIRRGTGNITVNGKPIIDYFRLIEARDIVIAPFLVTETLLDFDANITVRGGGHTGKMKSNLFLAFQFLKL